jgi:hypothetical protein
VGRGMELERELQDRDGGHDGRAGGEPAFGVGLGGLGARRRDGFRCVRGESSWVSNLTTQPLVRSLCGP